MFIINLTYHQPIADVEANLPQHIRYLEKNYARKAFVCSGRKNPRDGGIILCCLRNKAEVQKTIEEDPFYQNNIAKYEIIEFTPSKYLAGFEKWINE